MSRLSSVTCTMLGALAALAPLGWSPRADAAPARDAAAPPDDDAASAPDAAEDPEAGAAEIPEVATPEAEPPRAATPEPSATAGLPDGYAPSLQPPSTAPAVVATRAIARDRAPGRPRIGAMADVGVPDGATVSLVARPFAMLRAHAGLSHNLISLGERVGVTLTPLDWWACPSLSLEVGQFAEGNANPLARAVSGDATISSAVLDRVGYRYANAQLGVELGRQWFTFYLHAGVSRIETTVHNIRAETMSATSGTTSISFSADPTVQVWTVSARVGFVVYLAK